MNQEVVKRVVEAVANGAEHVVVKGENEQVTARRNKRSGNLIITVKQVQGKRQSA